MFQFASLAKNLRGKMTKNFFPIESALRSANVFPYALVLDVD